MIGRHAVAKDGQWAGALNLPDRTGPQSKLLKEGRLLDIRAVAVPLIDVARFGRDLVPLWILLCEITIELAKHFRLEGSVHQVAHFLQSRPDVLEEDILAGLPLPDRLPAQVNVHTPRERKRHHQRWRH